MSMRILILNNDLMTRQAALALEKNGHHVTLHGQADNYVLTLESLRGLLEQTSFDFCLMRNRRVLDRGFNPHGLELDEFLHLHRIPHVCWFTENPLASGTSDSTIPLYSRTHENCLFLSFSPEISRLLKAMGHFAGYLPLAVTPEWFQAPTEAGNSYLYQVSFIGRPKVAVPNGWRGNGPAPLVWPSLWGRHNSTLLHFQKEVLPRLDEEFLRSLERDPSLELSAFDGLAEGFTQYVRLFLERQLEIHLMFEAARLNMLKTIGWLLDAGVDLQLFGGEEWGKIFPSLGETPFVPFEEQAAVYRRSKINLVLSKLELRDAVHERVFNIGACGGLALAEHRDAILNLFPDGEVPTFRNRDELLEKVHEYLGSERKREETAWALHERVMREHTFQVRMEQMLQIVKPFLAGKRHEEELVSPDSQEVSP